ncbi:MAG: tetratricopeptide repeat protein [Polyangiaceae bacterium]|nr:tetratricopeptide repeat protein [Polyangiaceae bacterium]
MFASAPAPAQQRDPAGAEKLYDEAAALMQKGDYAAACPKFEQSHKLDPSPGALLSLAGCAEHEGKLATAWVRLKEARSLNADTASVKSRQEMEKFIASAIKRIEPRIPTLEVRVRCRAAAPSTEAAACTSGLVVMRGDQDVTGTLGTALPVDPGKHVIEARAAGFATKKAEETVGDGAHAVVDMVLERAVEQPPSPPSDPIVPAAPSPKPSERPPVVPPREKEEGLGPLRISGIALGATGLAIIGASIGLGVVAKDKQGALEELNCTPSGDDRVACPADRYDTATELADEGSSLALASTVTSFIGGAFAATGVVLFVVGSVRTPSTESGVTVSPSFGAYQGLSLSGRF